MINPRKALRRLAGQVQDLGDLASQAHDGLDQNAPSLGTAAEAIGRLGQLTPTPRRTASTPPA
jgi:hypothetical protein